MNRTEQLVIILDGLKGTYSRACGEEVSNRDLDMIWAENIPYKRQDHASLPDCSRPFEYEVLAVLLKNLHERSEYKSK